MIGTQELIMIFGVIVLLFGAAKLPELARSMGSSVGEFKKAQKESEKSLKEFEKSLTEPAPAKTRVQETAEKMGIDIRGKTDDQLLDEIQKSSEKPKEVSEP
ncbi:twin-arginine translocase TatA/TatE family subunit [Methanosarcina mazei]|jgi:sec-independent protein translocase protein TatA|uniref:Sec-independent protein translocase protein TatA n=1 Tax=Methanosarcina mazei TaxID=2209 RepID=A0A0F8KRD1_METMZ|nr:twin-arginine translocase TatA/TatE family subunit [Methanosarcina mazei]KKG72110.1 preprotein translocase [Methanosarcina mazei]KKG85521.1 preprotein translocase [Methanosarcina mazei]KKG90558.1 preprotein translocase [Methanosarcina mazei]KKH09545.1 preprotein translocase [Methanosarcina mazei]QIB91850.1 twin-arginine translocase TatA/TatE family subunit [Methanosarcina mazei]